MTLQLLYNQLCNSLMQFLFLFFKMITLKSIIRRKTKLLKLVVDEWVVIYVGAMVISFRRREKVKSTVLGI